MSPSHAQSLTRRNVDRQIARLSNCNVPHCRPSCMADWTFGAAAVQKEQPGRYLLGTNAMRVLIVDDHPIVASGCRTVLADEPATAILEAADAESAERVFLTQRPDICVIDIN